MPELSEPYVLGLLADLETAVPEVNTKLEQARERAGRVDAELSNLLRRLEEAKQAGQQSQIQSSKTVIDINERNMRVATLHQEIASIRRRADDIRAEMERVGQGAIQRQLRRERAKWLVQVEDREAEIEGIRGEVEGLRQRLSELEATVTESRDRVRAIMLELDRLQSQLPSPYLYTKLFESTVALAHCRFYLDKDPTPWRQDITQALGLMQTLHEDLRLGKYRLDRNSDLVGGRAMASAEAIYGAVAVGELEVAQELFAKATDPNLFFHHIFNVFRVWCVGLLLENRRAELRELLRRHQYAQGLRGGYVNAFIGLLAKDPRYVEVGIKSIVKHEWEIWQDASLVRGAGVANLGALGILQLAKGRGLQVSVKAPTVPLELLSARLPAARQASAT